MKENGFLAPGQSESRRSRFLRVCLHGCQGLGAGMLPSVTQGPAGFLQWRTSILSRHVLFSINNSLSLKLEVQRKTFSFFPAWTDPSIRVTWSSRGKVFGAGHDDRVTKPSISGAELLGSWFVLSRLPLFLLSCSSTPGQRSESPPHSPHREPDGKREGGLLEFRLHFLALGPHT